MVGGGDRNRIEVIALEQLAKIVIGAAGLVFVATVDDIARAVAVGLIYIAYRDHLDIRHAQEPFHVAGALAAYPDASQHDPIARRGMSAQAQGRGGGDMGEGHPRPRSWRPRRLRNWRRPKGFPGAD